MAGGADPSHAAAGGGQPTHAHWTSAVAPRLVARPIELPGQWEPLPDAAADDLGPPADCRAPAPWPVRAMARTHKGLA